MPDSRFPFQADKVEEHETLKRLHERESEDNEEQGSVQNDQTAFMNSGKRRGRPRGLGGKRKTITKGPLPEKKRRSRGKVRKSKSFISTSSDDSLSKVELPPGKNTKAETVPSPCPAIVSTSSENRPEESSSEEIIRPGKRRGLSEEHRQVSTLCF